MYDGDETLRPSRQGSFDNGNLTIEAFSPRSTFALQHQTEITEDVEVTAEAVQSRESQRPFALEYAHQKQTFNELKPRRRVKASRQDSGLSSCSR